MQHPWRSLILLLPLACLPVLGEARSCTEEEKLAYILERTSESIASVCDEPQPTPSFPELEMWELVKETSVVADVQAFIEAFPESPLAPAAWLKLEQFARKSRTSPHLLPAGQTPEDWTEPNTGMSFRRISGNCYTRGSPGSEVGRQEDESPQLVCVSSFWMGVHEVTNAQYRQFRPEHHNRSHRGYSLNGADQPAVHVSWEAAKAYAQWLTERHQHRYTFRLPTEAEWEYACRAGTLTARPWGNDLVSRRLNFSGTKDQLHPERSDLEDGYAVTAPVGKFSANPWGLHDMLGNVWEWVEDRYGDYENQQEHNPLHTGSSGYHVIRGGSWNHHSDNARCASRRGSFPSDRLNSIGFRLVRNS